MSVDIESKEIMITNAKTEPSWFRKYQRQMTKWFVKQTFRFLYFLVILIIIIVILGFLITQLSWERIIRFFLEEDFIRRNKISSPVWQAAAAKGIR